MQQQLDEDVPYIVTAETGIGEAVPQRQVRLLPAAAGPGWVWLVQYGARNYTLLRPAKDAGNCDGVTTALGAAKESGKDSSDSFLEGAGRRRRRLGRAGRLWAGSCSCVGGRPRQSVSDPS